MAAKRGKKKGLSEENQALLKAVQLAVSIQKGGSGLTDRQTHCRFFNGYVVATNDVQIVGVPVVGLTVDCCPHSKTLLAALERCTETTTFTLEAMQLVVKSGKVRVPVPCLEPAALSDLYPDSSIVEAGQPLADALGVVGAIIDEADDRPFCRSVYMGSSLVQGTHKGHVSIQVWHGIDNLPDLALPKESALSVSKFPAKLVSVGGSKGTTTFWFDNGAFIRTMLYDFRCPNIEGTLIRKTTDEPIKLTGDFYESIRTMLPFVSAKLSASGQENVMFFSEGKIWAGMEEANDVASYEYADSPLDNVKVNSHYLMMFETIAESIACDAFAKRIYFYGERFRAVIACMGHH